MRTRTIQAASVLVVLAAWQLATGVGELVVLPSPGQIARHVGRLLADGRFRSHLSVTVWRTTLAAVLAVPTGVAVGIAMGYSDRIKGLLAPFLYTIYPMPVISLLPLLLLVFGSQEQTLVFVAALGGFFMLVWNAMTAVEEITPGYYEVARDNGATSRYALFRELLVPGALPGIFTGLRLCVSTALLIVISVEFITADSGLGFFVWRAWGLYELPEMYAAIAVISALGLAIVYGLGRLQRYLVPWETDSGLTR